MSAAIRILTQHLTAAEANQRAHANQEPYSGYLAELSAHIAELKQSIAILERLSA